LNPRPHEAQLEDQKKPKKVQECHLEEGKPQKPTNGKKKQQNNEKSKKSSKPKENLKINTPLKSTPHNTLNASSPSLNSHLSCFFSHPPD
jgi:hypothetical protein